MIAFSHRHRRASGDKKAAERRPQKGSSSEGTALRSATAVSPFPTGFQFRRRVFAIDARAGAK